MRRIRWMLAALLGVSLLAGCSTMGGSVTKAPDSYHGGGSGGSGGGGAGGGGRGY